MLNLYPLYSSSSGNMYLISSENANILVDIGVTYKRVNEALSEVSKTPADIDAIFITHEHSDHVKGLNLFVKNNPNTPIYTAKGTRNYILNMLEKAKIKANNIFDISSTEKLLIKDLCIEHFNTSHDAVDPLGYKISCEDKSITIATDLGVMTNSVFGYLESSSLPVIECNYDKDMLFAGRYPFEIKRRIAGPYGHLSNEDSGQVILKLAQNGTRNFLLSHMSEHNNIPELAKETILSTLTLAGFDTNEFDINIATKDFSSEVYKLWLI